MPQSVQLAAQPELQKIAGRPIVDLADFSVSVHLTAQPEFQNREGEHFAMEGERSAHDFDAVRLIGEWKPLPRTFMRSLHLEFYEFWKRESDGANLARQRTWTAHNVDLAPGTRILVHYGLNVQRGVILRSGFGRYETQYRVQKDGREDMWIDKWRCEAFVSEDGGVYPEALGP
jgi:hypothetical protein